MKQYTQLNSDSSVYLAGCKVGGRSVEGYTYGKGGGEEPTPTYTSYVKIVVDAWKTAKAPMATEARLITIDELIEELGFEF